MDITRFNENRSLARGSAIICYPLFDLRSFEGSPFPISCASGFPVLLSAVAEL
jgi:hypothetical protein